VFFFCFIFIVHGFLEKTFYKSLPLFTEEIQNIIKKDGKPGGRRNSLKNYCSGALYTMLIYAYNFYHRLKTEANSRPDSVHSKEQGMTSQLSGNDTVAGFNGNVSDSTPAC